jgi:hypothetical protein
MPFNKKQFAAAAICVAATSVNVSAATMCDDVKLALASSKKFSEWKGKQIADNQWETTHTIFGFTKCVVVDRYFRCEQTSSSLDLAQRAYDAARKLIEACLPRSEWMYNQKTDPLPSQGFVHPDGRNGVIALDKTQAR